MDVSRRWRITRVALTAVYLFAGWLLFTGNVAPYSLVLGVIFALVVALATYRYFIEEHEAAWRSLVPRICRTSSRPAASIRPAPTTSPRRPSSS